MPPKVAPGTRGTTGRGPLTYPERRLRNEAKALRELANNAESLMPVWPKVGAYLSRMTRQQFATRGRRAGKPWAPLAASTRRQKERMGWPRSPLVRTGELREDFVGRPMAIEIYRPKSARFGTDLDKAIWQHYGTFRNGKRHIPARKIVVFTQADVDYIKQLILRHLMPKEG